MDYFDILKRAWNVTWKYKALWVLGFFVGGSGGGSGGGSSYQSSSGSGSGSPSPDLFSRPETWIADNLVLVASLAALLAVFILVMWVLSIAAQGGLVHLVNEAEDNRVVRLRDAWRVGFKYWGRTFMIGLVLFLPFLVLFAVMAAVFGASIVGLIAAGSGDSAGAAAVGGIGGLCCGLPIFIVLLVGAGVVISIVSSLAIRYGVLQEVTFGKAIKKGWQDMWGKRGALMFWLVMLLPGFAYAAVTGVVGVIFALPAVLLIMSERIISGVAVLVLAGLILMIPGAIYGTFVSSAWTIFFQRMNGTGTPTPVRQPAPAYSGEMAPPVPYMPEPPAPYMPVPPAPEPPVPYAPVPPAPEPPADV